MQKSTLWEIMGTLGTTKVDHGEKEENRKATGKEKEKERKERRKEEKEKEKKEKERVKDQRVDVSTVEVLIMPETAPKRAKEKENSTLHMDWSERNPGKRGLNLDKKRENPYANLQVYLLRLERDPKIPPKPSSQNPVSPGPTTEELWYYMDAGAEKELSKFDVQYLHRWCYQRHWEGTSRDREPPGQTSGWTSWCVCEYLQQVFPTRTRPRRPSPFR